ATDVPAEQIAHVFALAEPAGHHVEPGLQQTELGGVEYRYRDVELAALDARDTLSDLVDGVRGGRGGERGDGQSTGDGAAAERQDDHGQAVAWVVDHQRADGDQHQTQHRNA